MKHVNNFVRFGLVLSMGMFSLALAAQPTPPQQSVFPQLKLAGNWGAYSVQVPHDYVYGAAAIYNKSENIVCMEGLIRNPDTTWTDITVLPPEHRPTNRIIFNANAHDQMARVDIEPNGKVTWIAGGGPQTHKWVSLGGLAFSTQAGTPLAMGPDWVPFGDGWMPPSFVKKDKLCFVQGLVKLAPGKTWSNVTPHWDSSKATYIGTLPEGLRPKQQLIYHLNNDHGSVRVDVCPNGKIIVVTPGTATYISLNGIVFSLDEYTPLTLNSGWETYGHGYTPAGFDIEGDLCVLHGLVKRPDKNFGAVPIAILPAGARPEIRRIFGVQASGRTCRIDVLPDGKIWYVTGTNQGDTWVSLSGIIFSIAPQPMTLPANFMSCGTGELAYATVGSALLKNKPEPIATIFGEDLSEEGLVYYNQDTDSETAFSPIPIKDDKGNMLTGLVDVSAGINCMAVCLESGNVYAFSNFGALGSLAELRTQGFYEIHRGVGNETLKIKQIVLIKAEIPQKPTDKLVLDIWGIDEKDNLWHNTGTGWVNANAPDETTGQKTKGAVQIAGGPECVVKITEHHHLRYLASDGTWKHLHGVKEKPNGPLFVSHVTAPNLWSIYCLATKNPDPAKPEEATDSTVYLWHCVPAKDKDGKATLADAVFERVKTADGAFAKGFAFVEANASGTDKEMGTVLLANSLKTDLFHSPLKGVNKVELPPTTPGGKPTVLLAPAKGAASVRETAQKSNKLKKAPPKKKTTPKKKAPPKKKGKQAPKKPAPKKPTPKK